MSGEGGIRTHAPFRTNGFQDRLVMTTSIPLHTLTCFPPLRGDKMYSIITNRQCQQLFLIDFQSFQSLPTRNVPPPRLLCSSVLLLLSVLFLSDECYLTMPVLNCQYFLYFSCNSECSDNSIYVCKTISFTIITDTDLYSRKFFQEPKESARIWQNAHGFFHGFIL